MGHIDGPDAMALAFLRSAGVRQMIGYTVPTWYGYAGWGCLDYFLEQPGRYTLAEAFFANQQALLHRLEVNFPGIARVDTEPGKTYRKQVQLTPQARKNGLGQGDARGLLYDRDAVAFYGDPAWSARMAKMSCCWEQVLREEEGRFIFEIKPLRGEATFKPINTNGSQRGWRPIVEIFPWRLQKIEILQGKELEPLITDNFILVPNPRKPGEGPYRVVFRAQKADRRESRGF
jgi:zinc protease